MVCSKIISNCPVTDADIYAAENIFGPGITSFKCKNMQQTPDPVLTEYIKIHPGIKEWNRNINL